MGGDVGEGRTRGWGRIEGLWGGRDIGNKGEGWGWAEGREWVEMVWWGESSAHKVGGRRGRGREGGGS